MVRKIAVVTGTRAEYGILKPLLEKIKESKDLELKLFVTGLHLLPEFGLTLAEIENDGFKIEAKIKMYGKVLKPTYHGRALAEGIKGFSLEFYRTKPDLLVVLGDRFEVLAATLAAISLQLPVAHIHGGDKTDSGHIDESIRHAISRFAHIHFTATKEHAQRLIKMGEESWRIYNVGALGLDSIKTQKLISKSSLSKKLGLNFKKKVVVCIFHPVSLEKEKTGEQMHEIMVAIKDLRIQTAIIYPNNDTGSQAIIKEIENSRELPNIKSFYNLNHLEYISLLKYASVLIGNSSSGIIEAPSLRLPVVNIGSRNVGRDHSNNVIFVHTKKNNIIKAIKKTLEDKRFKDKVKNCINPYDGGNTSKKIINILSNIELNDKLKKKKITY